MVEDHISELSSFEVSAADQLLRAQQVAKLLQVSPSMVYKLSREGELPPVRLGKAVRFRQRDVVKLTRR